MNINIIYKERTQTVALESLVTPVRQTIWIGAQSEDVYNTLTVESESVFQCTITHDVQKDCWLLTEGQVRTECPRGLKSERSKACSMCVGRCVSLRPANPIYSLRMPQKATLINGVAIPDGGVELCDGDTISFV